MTTETQTMTQNLGGSAVHSFQTIEQLCSTLFDSNPVQCSPIVVTWAADKISDTQLAKRELKALNRRRARWAQQPVVFPFGHRLF